MVPPRLQVTVVVDSAAPACEGDCVTDWWKTENQELARRAVASKHGHEVALEFRDIRNAVASAAPAGWHGQTRNLSFPVLLVNNAPCITGPFDLRMLLDMIETELDKNL